MPTVEANSQNSSSSVAAVKASEVNQKTWIIIRQLGEGAFGEVKLIVDSANANCCAAMKCVDLSKHSEIIDSLRKEALLQRMLRGHRNVIQYIGMRFEGQNEFQLFLEYAAGGELFDRIEPDKGMPKVNAQFYFRQLIDGIKYIHSKGIAHRDLKPENLLLSYNDTLKISDFGMATVFRHNNVERLLTTKCGTRPYISPQVLEGRYRGEANDIWSCGIVLVALLAGELPWEEPSSASILFLRWVESPDISQSPWIKLDSAALGLLQEILNVDENNRATVDQIQNHGWFTADFSKFLDDTSDECASCPTKRRRKSLKTIAEIDGSVSQPMPNLPTCDSQRSVSELKSRSSAAHVVNSFSQPEDIENMLLNCSQIDASQGTADDPLKLLVRRMTRFCVTVSTVDAINVIISVCESVRYTVKKRGPLDLIVSCGRGLSFIVAVYEMKCEGKRVLVDFRRSRGDGLEFKRVFITIKSKLGSIVSKEGEAWLERKGLVCSQALNELQL